MGLCTLYQNRQESLCVSLVIPVSRVSSGKGGLVELILTKDSQSPLDKAPRLSIRIVIWILPSDTETSAATPCEVMRKK